jgi:hypothetical protein
MANRRSRVTTGELKGQFPTSGDINCGHSPARSAIGVPFSFRRYSRALSLSRSLSLCRRFLPPSLDSWPDPVWLLYLRWQRANAPDPKPALPGDISRRVVSSATDVVVHLFDGLHPPLVYVSTLENAEETLETRHSNISACFASRMPAPQDIDDIW